MKYKESDIVWVEISSTIRGPYFGPVKLEKEDGKDLWSCLNPKGFNVDFVTLHEIKYKIK